MTESTKESKRQQARELISLLLTTQDTDGYYLEYYSNSEKESFRTTLNKVRQELTIEDIGHIKIESGTRTTSQGAVHYIRTAYTTNAGMRIMKVLPGGGLKEIDQESFNKARVVDTFTSEEVDQISTPQTNSQETTLKYIKMMVTDGLSLEEVKEKLGDKLNTPEAQEALSTYYPQKKVDLSDWPPTAVDLAIKAKEANTTKEAFQKERPQFSPGKKYEKLCDIVFSTTFNPEAAKNYVKDVRAGQ